MPHRRLVFLITSIIITALSSGGFRQAQAQIDVPADAQDIVGTVPGGANMRNAPNSDAGVLISVPAGASVTVTAQTHGHSVTLNGTTSDVWYLLRYESGDSSLEGYIWSRLVSVPADAVIPAIWQVDTVTVSIPPNTTLFIQGHAPEDVAIYEKWYTLANNFAIDNGVDLASLGSFAVFIFNDREKQVAAVADYYHVPTTQALHLTGAVGGYGASKSDSTIRGTFYWSGQYICSSGYALPVLCGAPGEYLGTIFTTLAKLRYDENNASGDFYSWLDGAIEYIDWLLLPDMGYPLAAEYDRVSSMEGMHRIGQSIQAAFNTPYGNARHTMGQIAVEYLVSITGDDPRILFDFYSRVKDHPGRTGWHTAFAETFGMTIDEFSAQFDAYRAIHFPSSAYDNNGVAGVVEDAQGNGVMGVWVWACPLNPTYDCLPTTTIYGRPGDFNLAVFPATGPVDALVALGTSPDPDSIFGYFSATGDYTLNRGKAYPPHIGKEFVSYWANGVFTTDRHEAETHLLHIDRPWLGIVVDLPPDLNVEEMLPVTCTWVEDNPYGQPVDIAFCPPKSQ